MCKALYLCMGIVEPGHQDWYIFDWISRLRPPCHALRLRPHYEGDEYDSIWDAADKLKVKKALLDGAL